MSHFIHLSVIGELPSIYFFFFQEFIFHKSFFWGLFVWRFVMMWTEAMGSSTYFFNDNEEATTGRKANVINDVLSAPLASLTVVVVVAFIKVSKGKWKKFMLNGKQDKKQCYVDLGV